MKYNEARRRAGEFTDEHVDELVRRFQKSQGLTVDGLFGPVTRAALERSNATDPQDRRVNSLGWLERGVQIVQMHASWRYSSLRTANSQPLGIVAHYTDTGPGTGLTMARRRTMPRTIKAGSWHVTIETDGTVLQMAPFNVGCWHAGSPSAKKIPGVGWANRTTVGIELVGDGSRFPAAQVAAARSVWRALVRAYPITRAHAMIQHSEIDPTRRRDPGPEWMSKHAKDVLDHAYA